MGKRKTIEEAFWPKVDKRGPDECWPWTGWRNSKGYGRLARQSPTGSRRLSAPSVAWSLANGTPFPASKMALHSCDNPPCCNPAHIWPGSNAENVADMVAKGRANFSGLRWLHKQRASLTRCRRGHEFTLENTARRDNGARSCRTCHRAADAAYRLRKRQSQPRLEALSARAGEEVAR